MTNTYFNPKDAADFIQETHNIVYNIEYQIERAVYQISELSEAITREDDLRIADQLLLEIYKNSVKLQVILIGELRLEKMFIEDYGEDFFNALEKKTDKVYHLCQYLSKRHDIKAHHDISKTNNIIIFLTAIIVYDAIIEFPKCSLSAIGIRFDTLIVSIILYYIIFIYSKPQESDRTGEGEVNRAP